MIVNTSATNKKSPEIKKYTIDEKTLAKNREALPLSEAVTSLIGNEFARGDIKLYEQVSHFFESIGNSVHNKDFGDIGLTRRGIRDDIGHGLGAIKAITFKAVPDVLSNGITIEYRENHKGRGYDTAVIAAAINIADERNYVAVVIKRDNIRQGKNISQRFYMHEVYSKEKASELFSTVRHLLQDVGHGNSDANTTTNK